MTATERRRVGRRKIRGSEVTSRLQRAGESASCVWRDAFGPGFAVAASGRMVAQAAATALGDYRCS
ncbi:MAG: hypothetical protein PVF87_00545 [Acidimicrobiia bacterium]